MDADITVVGGGLAGIFAALKCSELGSSVVLIDEGLPESNGKLGGFAKFSGAKFSLPPAGMGLLPVAGDRKKLFEVVNLALETLGLEGACSRLSRDLESGNAPQQQDAKLALRKYKSIVLLPDEIDELVSRLSKKLTKKVRVVRGRCTSLAENNGAWKASVTSSNNCHLSFSSSALIFGGGRTAGTLLESTGVKPRVGKGIDVGIRVEFLSQRPLENLRASGPDAKYLYKSCRTFCLNQPGEIFYYRYENIMIPGGIVTCSRGTSSNMGMLCRTTNKREILERISGHEESIPSMQEVGMQLVDGEFLGGNRDNLRVLFGDAVISQLEEFGENLAAKKLVDWSYPHKIHLPLLDWHWDVYGDQDSHRTNINGIYVIGDSSGHARGLLQAAVSGLLCAEECHG